MKALGKNTKYINYTEIKPELLEIENRKPQRDISGFSKILDNQKVFGLDYWHCYEICYKKNNETCRQIIRITYSANTQFIVESKSLKLYLNSFHFINFVDDMQVLNTINQDLSNILYSHVTVDFIVERKRRNLISNELSFQLRSNCKITQQPDFGILFLQVEEKDIDFFAIVEFLNKVCLEIEREDHFHEEACEIVFEKLTHLLKCKFLICCQYSRRGGIDINVVRSNSKKLFNKFSQKFLKNNIIYTTIYQ